MSQSPANPSSSKSGKKSAACCGGGCLTILILSVVGAIGLTAFTKKAVGDFVEKHTSDAPVQVAMPAFSEQQVTDVTERFNQFLQDVSAGKQGESLRLSQDDINVLISKHPKFSALSKSAAATIENDQLTIDSSFDIDKMGLSMPGFIGERLKGKYFNGTITVEVTTIGGAPAVFIQNIEAGDVPLPSVIVESLKSENILKNRNSNPEVQMLLDKISEAKIEDNHLVLTPTAAKP